MGHDTTFIKDCPHDSVVSKGGSQVPVVSRFQVSINFVIFQIMTTITP